MKKNKNKINIKNKNKISFKNKYFFFLKIDNITSIPNIWIFVSFALFLHQIFVSLYFLFSSPDDWQGILTLKSSLLYVIITRFAGLWLDIKYLKEFFPLFIQKIKNKDIKYEELEVFILSEILLFFLIIFNWVFVVDWELIQEIGYVKPVFFCILANSISLFHYLKNKRAYEKKIKNNIKKEKV